MASRHEQAAWPLDVGHNRSMETLKKATVVVASVAVNHGSVISSVCGRDRVSGQDGFCWLHRGGRGHAGTGGRGRSPARFADAAQLLET